jgi:conjugal transfer pilus assembly protein TrbC
MSPRLHLVALAIVLASAALGGALAQDAGELDLDAIRARAAAQAGDAEALATTARERAKALASEAKTSAEQSQANGSRYIDAAKASARPTPSTDTFDFDKMIAAAGASDTADLGEAPRLIAFASTSMPAAALRQMIDDVGKAGGVVVYRGLPQGNAKLFTAALSKVLRQGERPQGVGIDPRLFRAFRIDAVPAYVVASSDFDLCDGFDCTTSVPPFDMLTGNVTAAYALETFAQGGGPGAQIAAQHLARLESSRP